MSKRPINVRLLIRTAKQLAKEYTETGFTALGPGGKLAVQIDMECMAEIAPISDWVLNFPQECEKYPYEHSYVIDGVKFFAITDSPIILPER